jgi:hypothetical protein
LFRRPFTTFNLEKKVIDARLVHGRYHFFDGVFEFDSD